MSDTATSIALLMIFVLIAGLFSCIEAAFVSLRQSQIDTLATRGKRGARTASVARDPNRFLAAIQIGATLASLSSATFGASRLAPELVPAIEAIGVSEAASNSVALILVTVILAYVSLVISELVPKRIGLQRPEQVALRTAPAIDSFATLMRPVMALLAASTNGVVRLVGLDPHQAAAGMSEDEYRQIVVAREGLAEQERVVLGRVLDAGQRTVAESMRPRGEVRFLDDDLTVAQAIAITRSLPYSRYPVTGIDFDDVTGFVHVRDLYDAEPDALVRDLQVAIPQFPSTVLVLTALTALRAARRHIAVVVDEYGGTDGIVTLEDLIEELVGDITDERDVVTMPAIVQRPGGQRDIDAGLTLEDFARLTGVTLPQGPYETVAGYVLAALERLGEVGDVVPAPGATLTVAAVSGRRITRVDLTPQPATP